MQGTMNQLNTLWERVLIKLSKSLENDRHSFEVFFSNSKLASVDDDLATVIVSSKLTKKYLGEKNKHRDLLQDCVDKTFGHSYRLRFLLPDEFVEPTKKEEDSITDTSHTFFSNCKMNPKYTFDSFVVGSCNEEAVRASLVVSEDAGASFNPLFIYSKSGLGKTHLLHAIGNYYQEKHPNDRVLYITTDSFIDEFVNYVTGSKENQSLRDFFKTVDLLLVDDIQFLSDKTKTAEMFFYIFNSLVNNGKQVILTSDRHPKDLRGLEERLVSRFNMGLSVNIQNPDTSTALKILKRKIESQGLDTNNYDEEGLLFLAETFSKNVRELEGALNRLLFHTLSIKTTEKISLQDIKEAVKIMMPNSEKKKTLSEDEILDAVSNYFHISTEQILSNVRTAQIALARRISMYLIRYMLGSSYLQIGSYFKRDHSTVMTGVEKVGKEMKTNIQLSKTITDIKNSLKK